MVKTKEENNQGEIVIATFTKKILPFGNSAHIPIGKEFIGNEAEVKIKGKWFLCKGCHDVIYGKNNFSPDPSFCIGCYKENEAIKNNQCLSCNGPNPEKDYWGNCEKCWNKHREELEEWNKKHGTPLKDFDKKINEVEKKKKS